MRVAQPGRTAEFLAAVPLFAGLDADELADLAAATESFALADGSRLFAQNDPGDGAYLVSEGALSIGARTPGDGHRELERVGAGGVLGEVCLLDGGRRSAEAHAVGAAQGLRIDYDRFAALRAGGRPAAFAVLARLRAEVARRIAGALAELGADAEQGGGSPTALSGHAAEADECMRLLAAFPGFERFRAADWNAFARAVRRLDVTRGEVLSSPGSVRSELLLVARGALRETLGGTQVLVHGPGALANVAALVEQSPWPTRLEVREDAILYALPAEDFAALAEAADGFAPRLYDLAGRQLTRDLRRLSRVGNRALDPALEIG
jgi:CRP-like cAMP-binding protein